MKQVVIWGHKLHTHTHSYIHFGFKRAFDYLGYNTLWLDDNDDIEHINFKNTLFITEGQVDNNIPLLEDGYYVLHNCNCDKYKFIKNKIILQVYTHDVIHKHNANKIDDNDLCYYKQDCLFMPWATDLLPYEIDENIELVKSESFQTENYISLIGCLVQPWDQVRTFCINNNIKFLQIGGFDKNNVTTEENVKILQKSIMSPAIQRQWQVENGYIPCRIFKNISYGKMGMTNNLTVYNLFNKKILYDKNIEKLMNKGIIFEQQSSEIKNNSLIPLMEYVKTNHTYLNRIKIILWVFNII